MDRDAKRKASSAALGDDEGRAAKRQRLPASNNLNESLLDAGLRFITTLKNAKDKTGRPIATDFVELPDRDDYPDYYEHIALPVSINTIEVKLKNEQYFDLAGVESDLKRMVNNAKTYNEKGSDIYDDAERLRKTASNWMTRFNPAYKDPKYVALPTPLPEGMSNGVRPDLSAKRGAAPTPQQSKAKASEMRPSAPVDNYPDSEFAGKNFQQAQDMIIAELIDFREPESQLKIFQPFIFLPSRALKDYYEVIRHPVSLDAVRKKVRGIHGKSTNSQGTGISDFNTWAAFEEEVSFIWKNCREYNEDGSEMYNLADEFEEVFKSRVEEAKAKVEAPSGPTLKLKMGAKPPAIKIRLGGAAKDSPGPQSHPGTPDQRNSSTPGASDSLARQHHMPVNGNHYHSAGTPQSAANPFGGARPGSIPPLGQVYSRSGSAGSPPLTSNGVKAERPTGYSPAPGAYRPMSATAGYANHVNHTASMLPPTSAARMLSGSPHPYAQPHIPQYHIQPPPNGFEKKYRAPGKTAKHSLLPTLTLKSHPTLNLAKPYNLNIPAHSDRAQQSLTIALPSSHHSLLVIPTLPASVTSRPYRLIVLVNGQKLSQMAPTPSSSHDTGSPSDEGASGSGTKRPRFEARLKVGEVNQIDVEVLAALKTEEAGEKKQKVEWEKCSVFVYLR